MNKGHTLLAFIAGAVAGVAAALLMAPDSGENTREKIRQKAVGAADKAREKILEGLDAVESVLEEND